MVPVLIAATAGGLWLATLAHRRSSPLLGVLLCAGTVSLCRPSPGPTTWCGSCRPSSGSHWPLTARWRTVWPRSGCPLLERAYLVGAVQEHVGSAPRVPPAHRRQLILLRHGDLHRRRGRCWSCGARLASAEGGIACRKCRPDRHQRRVDTGLRRLESWLSSASGRHHQNGRQGWVTGRIWGDLFTPHPLPSGAADPPDDSPLGRGLDHRETWRVVSNGNCLQAPPRASVQRSEHPAQTVGR